MEEGTWVFQEAMFESIPAWLKITECPLDSLTVYGSSHKELPFQDPDLVLRVLLGTLASDLVNLDLLFCCGVPVELFLLLLRLKDLNLNHIFPRLAPLCHRDTLQKGLPPSLDTFSF